MHYSLFLLLQKHDILVARNEPSIYIFTRKDIKIVIVGPNRRGFKHGGFIFVNGFFTCMNPKRLNLIFSFTVRKTFLVVRSDDEVDFPRTNFTYKWSLHLALLKCFAKSSIIQICNQYLYNRTLHICSWIRIDMWYAKLCINSALPVYYVWKVSYQFHEW